MSSIEDLNLLKQSVSLEELPWVFSLKAWNLKGNYLLSSSIIMVRELFFLVIVE
jgi:hypothetical protein